MDEMENHAERSLFCMDGNTLKLIAMLTMLLDHIGAGLIEMGILRVSDPELFGQIMATDSGQMWLMVDTVCRTVGRLAFPIFCFLLVEGYLHTRNVKRYFFNLLLFAFISEIPFDLAFMGSVFDFGYQNVYFTLAVGLLTLVGLERFKDNRIARAAVMLAGGSVALFLKSDYDFIGVFLIAAFYLLRGDKRRQFITAGVILFLESVTLYGAAVLALLPIHFYGGTRKRTRLKYAFYFFYPAHIMLIFLFRYFVMR